MSATCEPPGLKQKEGTSMTADFETRCFTPRLRRNHIQTVDKPSTSVQPPDTRHTARGGSAQHISAIPAAPASASSAPRRAGVSDQGWRLGLVTEMGAFTWVQLSPTRTMVVSRGSSSCSHRSARPSSPSQTWRGWSSSYVVTNWPAFDASSVSALMTTDSGVACSNCWHVPPRC